MEGFLAGFLLAMGVFTQTFLVVMLMALSEVHSKSNVFLLSLSRELSRNGAGIVEVRWIRRHLLALSPLSLRVGSAYFIDKPIVLTSMQITFDSTVDFLLMNLRAIAFTVLLQNKSDTYCTKPLNLEHILFASTSVKFGVRPETIRISKLGHCLMANRMRGAVT